MPISIYEMRYMGYDERYEDRVIVSIADETLFFTPSCNDGILKGFEILDAKDWEAL